MAIEYGHQENAPRAARLPDYASSTINPGHLFFPIDRHANPLLVKKDSHEHDDF
jgi:hypothetical protein